MVRKFFQLVMFVTSIWKLTAWNIGQSTEILLEDFMVFHSFFDYFLPHMFPVHNSLS